MCGLAGLLTFGDPTPERLSAIASRMGARIAHRGPDSAGLWSASGEPVALAHQRLSILDLSPQGAQPMHSHCGRFVIAYNGEIYNFKEVKSQIEAKRGRISWRGHSDTEILLEAIVDFGVDTTLRLCNGMFALALWDRKENVLCLARDRLGKKPLYFALLGDDLAFASEIKALRTHPGWLFRPDCGALQSFLRHGYVSAPRTGIEGVAKLPPGTVLWVRPGDVSERRLPPPRRYWDPTSLRPLAEREPVSPSAIEEALEAAVRDRMVADVPVGAFLSGGVDSSLIVALMTRLSGPGVRTYTIGIGDSSEAPHAAAVAKRLGTRHTDLVLEATEASALVPTVVATFDEPLADSSAVPTWIVSRLAAADVKVVLSGDGADELFAGYTRYSQNARLWGWRRALPPGLARLARKLAARIDAPTAGSLSAILSALTSPDATSFYRCRVSHTRSPERLLPHGVEMSTASTAIEPLRGSIVREMMYLDLVSYLAEDILAKVDRASMAHALEVRSPFLDDRIVRLAWSLPDQEISGDRRSKQHLKALLHRLLPRELVERPKAGFGLPVESWLAGPLRAWAEEQTVGSHRLKDLGFETSVFAPLWKSFLNGRQRLAGTIWNAVVLGAWLDSQA